MKKAVVAVFLVCLYFMDPTKGLKGSTKENMKMLYYSLFYDRPTLVVGFQSFSSHLTLNLVEIPCNGWQTRNLKLYGLDKRNVNIVLCLVFLLVLSLIFTKLNQ